MNTIEMISTIIGSVAGSSVLSTWITYRATKRKSNADAASSVAESAKLLVETMRQDLNHLKDEMQALRSENLLLQKRVFELEAELRFYKIQNGTTTIPSPAA